METANMQIKIHNRFGPQAQGVKLREEFHEFIDEYFNFEELPNSDNITRLLEELQDFSNVLEGIAIVEYGLNMDEFKGYKRNKLVRTLKIIQKCIAEEREYDEVRKEFD